MVGYSRLMGADEAGTHARLKALREQVIEPLFTAYHGRIVKLMGDGILAEFSSVVDALACAVKVQRAVSAGNAGVADDRHIVFRIGIHLGDVIVEDNDIYGDGVNIAARLESLAEPGGICISQAVFATVGNKLPLVYDDPRAQQVKNIAEPVFACQVRVPADAMMPAESVLGNKPATAPATRQRLPWRAAAVVIAMAVGVGMVWSFSTRVLLIEPDTATGSDAPPARAAKPSIAVLPFANMGNDPEQDYFGDGISEYLITDLSKVSGLLVIARHSAFAYKGRSVDIGQIASELGVRYVLEGSVRYAGDKVRINAQLIDTSTGHPLWAERYDRDYGDIFQVQDDVISHIVQALALRLTSAEQTRLARIPTANLEAYDYYLRAKQAANGGVLALPSAFAYYEKAIALDPEFVDAYTGYAWTALYTLRGGWDQVLSAPVARRQAYEAASRALALDANAARAYTVLGMLQLIDREHDQALLSVRKAVALAPGSAEAHLSLGVTLAYSGRLDDALAALETALRLNPRPAPRALLDVGHIRFTAGLYQQALAPLEQTVAAMPGSDDPLKYLAANYARLDRLDRARAAIDQVLGLYSHQNVAVVRLSEPYARAEDLDHFLDALRKAGLPEWPFGYQGSAQDRLDNDAIDALTAGHTWIGRSQKDLAFVQQFDADGNAVYRSERSLTISTATVEDGRLCLRSEAEFHGRKNCGHVYRNPAGTAGQQNEYTYVNAGTLLYFSVMR